MIQILIDWGRLRELRVWIKSDDGQTNGQMDRQTEFPLVYSTPVRGWVNIKHRRRRNVKIHDTPFTFLTILLLWQFYFFDNFYLFDSGRYSTIMSATRLTSMSSTMSTTPHRPSCQPPISSPCQLTRRHLVILKKKGYPISRESWSLGLVNCIHDINSQNVYTSRLWTCYILPKSTKFAWILKQLPVPHL